MCIESNIYFPCIAFSRNLRQKVCTRKIIPRDVARTLRLGGVRLTLPDFTRLISCSIGTGHYLFQCLKAMFVCYLQTAKTGRLVWSNSLVSTMYLRPTMVGPRTIFKIKVLRPQENAILNMVFTNNRAILLTP